MIIAQNILILIKIDDRNKGRILPYNPFFSENGKHFGLNNTLIRLILLFDAVDTFCQPVSESSQLFFGMKIMFSIFYNIKDG